MDLKEILAISGKSGLFKVITQTKAGLIVESLLDQKRIPVYASDKVSNLEEISIYTDDKEVPLKDIFKLIFDKESGGKAIDPKSADQNLKEYFLLVLPNYDKEKVYVSDIKKVMNWYNTLHDNNMLIFEEEKEEKDKTEGKEAVKEEAVKDTVEKTEEKTEEKQPPIVEDKE